jgi:hypothetical protein
MLLLTAAAIWATWVLGHYYAFPFVGADIVDGLRGARFPYWSDAAARALRSLAGATVTLLGAWGLGRLWSGALLRNREGEPEIGRAERFTYDLACGLVTLSWLLSVMAWMQAYRPAVVRIVLACSAATSVLLALLSFLRRSRLPATVDRGRFLQHPGSTLLPIAGILVALSFAFVGALAPEIEYDALWYHLWLPQRWLQSGGPVDVVHEYVSLYPLSWDLLYGAAATIGGTGAAKLLHFSCLPLLAAATWLLARTLFPTANAYIAAALCVVSPTIIWEATTAYVDLALALFLTLSVHALIKFEHTSSRRWLVLSAVMMGAALSIKHLALLALASFALVFLAQVIARRLLSASAKRDAVLFVALALAAPAPWYARAYVASGNPVFPDMYRMFGARPPERWSPLTEQALDRFKARFGRTRSLRTIALLPWDMSVHGASYGGTFGPAFLILVPLAIVAGHLSRPARLVGAGAGIYLMLWASPVSSFQMRFLVPLVPVLAAFASAGIARLTEAAATTFGASSARLVMAPVMVLLFLNLPPFTQFHESDRVGWSGWLTHVMRAAPTRVVLGAMTVDQYLRAAVPSFAAWKFIDTLPESSRILTFSGGDHLYSSRDRLWSDATAAYPVTWGAAGGQELAAASVARRMGISHVLFDKKFLEDGTLADLAISSVRMRECCLTLVWEDARYELHRLHLPHDPAGGD